MSSRMNYYASCLSFYLFFSLKLPCDARRSLRHQHNDIAMHEAGDQSFSLLVPAANTQSCTTLINRGTHFDVDVKVGTPAQPFSLVADTGSQLMIVASCVCQDAGNCPTDSRCFRGSNRSSTFSIDNKDGKGPPGMTLTFGSGPIQVAIATDVAEVGSLKATMDDSLLLMTNQKLDIVGMKAFEGILGLGRVAAEKPGKLEKGPRLDRVVTEIANRSGLKSYTDPTSDDSPSPKGFLEHAGVSSFSLCFNDNGANGTLEFDTPLQPGALTSIGDHHWALDLRGIRVGSETAVVPNICSGEKLAAGQETACGIIPDSGSTAINVPTEYLVPLMESLCDNWARCRDNHTAFLKAQAEAHDVASDNFGFDPFKIMNNLIGKFDILQWVLSDCSSWMAETDGLNEVPSLHFELAGKMGETKSLEIPAWAYIMEQDYEIPETTYEDVGPIGKIPVGVQGSGKFRRICRLAFSSFDYTTPKHGPVWILGTPAFYTYKVAYDMSPLAPAMSFTDLSTSPCTTCGSSFVATNMANHTSAFNYARRPRQVSGLWRSPGIDVGIPL